MKKLSTLLIEQIILLNDKNTALYILKDLIESEWDNLLEDEQKQLQELMDSVKES